jgi:hypothetical protein
MSSEPITSRHTRKKDPSRTCGVIRTAEHLKTYKLRGTPSKHSSPVSPTCGDWTGNAGIIGEWWVGIFVPFGIVSSGLGAISLDPWVAHLQPGDPVDPVIEESEECLDECVRPQPLGRWDGSCLFEQDFGG